MTLVSNQLCNHCPVHLLTFYWAGKFSQFLMVYSQSLHCTFAVLQAIYFCFHSSSPSCLWLASLSLKCPSHGCFCHVSTICSSFQEHMTNPFPTYFAIIMCMSSLITYGIATNLSQIILKKKSSLIRMFISLSYHLPVAGCSPHRPAHSQPHILVLEELARNLCLLARRHNKVVCFAPSL